MPAKTRCAQLIARQEGFGVPDMIPTVRRNPGDLRHSPHSSHTGIGKDGIGIIDSDDHGWEDLERQLALFAERGMTLEEAIYTFAPPNENDSVAYLRNVSKGLGVPPDMPMTVVLKIPAIVERGA